MRSLLTALTLLFLATPLAARAAEIPSQLHLFGPAIYEIVPGIDAALGLTVDQRSRIAARCSKASADLEPLEEALRAAESTDEKREAAKRLAKARLKSRSEVKAVAEAFLTPTQKGVVSAADALLRATAEAVEREYADRFARVSGKDREELLRIQDEIVAADFKSALWETFSEEQREAVAQATLRIKLDAKVAEIQERRAAAKRLREERERDAERAKQGFGSFTVDAVGHDSMNAYLCVYACHFIYANYLGLNGPDYTNTAKFAREYRKKMQSVGLDEVEFISDSAHPLVDAQCSVMSNAKLVLVAFRGTEGIERNLITGFKDWVLTDFNALMMTPKAWKSERRDIGVHTGFFNATMRIYDQVAHEIEQQGGLDGSKRIFVTGHSLGGAMAQVFAYQWELDRAKNRKVNGKKRQDIRTIYTFGSPRVGTPDFGLTLEGGAARKHQRWTCSNDIIPMTPPNVPLFAEYEHCGETNNILSNGSIRYDDEEFRGIGDPFQHYPSLYAQAIYKKLPEALRKYAPMPPVEK